MKKILILIALVLCLTSCSAKEEMAVEDVTAKENTEESIEEETEEEIPFEFIVTSSSINEEGRLLTACAFSNGNNEHPAVTFPEVEAAEDYKILMIDTSANNWVHWIADTDQCTIAQNESLSDSQYKGPYPPGDDHCYKIIVYALDERIDPEGLALDTTCDLNSIEEQFGEHVLYKNSVSGLYSPGDNNE